MSDLISRKALIKEMQKISTLERISDRTGDMMLWVDKKDVYKAIEEQPTIQPQGIDKGRLIEFLKEEQDGWKCLCGARSASCGPSAIEDVLAWVNQQPQTGWIPVSERLPEEDGKYLCTTRHGEVHILRFSTDLYSVDKHYFEHYKDKYKKGFHKDWRVEITGLKAWQPLPQPYKE